MQPKDFSTVRALVYRVAITALMFWLLNKFLVVTDYPVLFWAYWVLIYIIGPLFKDD